MAYRDEIDDAFDAVVFLEERCYENGYKQGYQDGKLKGLQEGRQLGLMKGCEVGGEVGFYLGFVSMWLEMLRKVLMQNKETLKKNILALPINDVTNEELFVNLENIRAKFRQELAQSTVVVVWLDSPSENKTSLISRKAWINRTASWNSSPCKFPGLIYKKEREQPHFSRCKSRSENFIL
ncbi:hypothetical protein OS493_017621 [Desmophyllum pertusum]|uniref:Essential protein Yae1 N-terminal domain-containing protein n=1 Tax=Desmophyllum pertusum TaxID=174260 RepID=A0A9X0CYJ8_9CNID|nr:hypothetical protein OS493_017621 [Desmophyllum pertusum]